MKQKLKAKSYRLTDDRSGESFMLKTGKKGNLTVFDEEKQIRRAIRHCPNQRSIFRDEQDDHAVVSPIIFYNGYLHVGEQEPITQQFLDAHPSNAANGGGWFEEVNEEVQAKESIELDELVTDIKYAIRAKAKEEDGIHALSAVVSVILGSVEETSKKGTEELKRVLYTEAEADPSYFTNEQGDVTIFDDDAIYRKYIVLTALKDGILKKSVNHKSMMWAKNSELIASAPVGLDLVDYFSDYLTTDEGMLVMEEIKRRS